MTQNLSDGCFSLHKPKASWSAHLRGWLVIIHMLLLVSRSQLKMLINHLFHNVNKKYNLVGVGFPIVKWCIGTEIFDEWGHYFAHAKPYPASHWFCSLSSSSTTPYLATQWFHSIFSSSTIQHQSPHFLQPNATNDMPTLKQAMQWQPHRKIYTGFPLCLRQSPFSINSWQFQTF